MFSGQDSHLDFESHHSFVRKLLDTLRPDLRIAVVHGGDNRDPHAVLHRTHQPRTWKSYESVSLDIRNSLRRSGFHDVDLVTDGRGLASRLEQANTQVAWLNTGGVQGFDPLCHAAARLESLGVAYVGHKPGQYAIMDDKYICRLLLQRLGLPTPRSIAWHPADGSMDQCDNESFHDTFKAYNGPFVVKPRSGRGSNHVSYVDRVSGLQAAVDAVYHKTHSTILIEEYLPGREFCVAVGAPLLRRQGDLVRTDRPTCFSHIERVLRPDERIFTSQDIVPINEARVRLLVHPHDEPTIRELTRIGELIYQELHLNFLIRVDIREDADGQLRVLEVNPKPDLAYSSSGHTSLLALGLQDCGMTYDDLILCQLLHCLDEARRCVPRWLASVLAGEVEQGDSSA